MGENRIFMHGESKFMRGTSHFSKQAEPSEIWVLDDDENVLNYLSTIIAAMGSRTKCFREADELFGQEAQSGAALILVDWLLPKPEGLRVAARCRRRWAQTPVLLMSGQATVPLAVEAMRQGLLGVIEKTLSRDELVFEIKAALTPSQPSLDIDDSHMRAKQRIACLSQRKLEILKLISVGLPNKVVALRMQLSLRTIEKERSAIFVELGVTSAAEAAGMLVLATSPAKTSILPRAERMDGPNPGPPPLGITSGWTDCVAAPAGLYQ